LFPRILLVLFGEKNMYFSFYSTHNSGCSHLFFNQILFSKFSLSPLVISVAMAEYPELDSWNNRNASLLLDAAIQDQGSEEVLAFFLRLFLLTCRGHLLHVCCHVLFVPTQEERVLVFSPCRHWSHYRSLTLMISSKFPLPNTSI
jgi:hypothetical protein